jgi:hypothetical protein
MIVLTFLYHLNRQALQKGGPGRSSNIVAILQFSRWILAKAVQAWLEASRDRIEVYWLPRYCPSLTERLWGHLWRTATANVLFAAIDDLTGVFRKGVTRVNSRRGQMASCSGMTETPNSLRSAFCSFISARFSG